MNARWLRAALLLLCADCAAPVAIEVRNAGGRVMDSQFSAILKQTFEDSARFKLTNQSSMLVATIRTIQRAHTGRHAAIYFAVDIARHGRVIGTTDVSCETDSLEQCAATVVRDTRFFLDGGH